MFLLRHLFRISYYVLGCLATTQAVAQAHEFIVKGQVSGSTPPTTIYLLYPTQKNPTKPDSARVRNGRFEFRGKVSTTQEAILVMARPGQRAHYPPRYANGVSFYLEPGTICVVSTDSLDNALASGTPLNNDRAQIEALGTAFRKQVAVIMRERLVDSVAYAQNPTFRAKLDGRYDTARTSYHNALGTFIKGHPRSPVSLEALTALSVPALDLEVVAPLYDGLTADIRVSKAGQAYASRLAAAQRTSIGALAPDFTQTDANGRQVKLSDFRGQYVLLDFWASWCGPCRRENPTIVGAYNKFKKRGFTVLGVSLDRKGSRAAWLKAVVTDGLTWTQVADFEHLENVAAEMYDVKSIPQNFLIGPDGKIIAVNLHGEALSRKLASLLSPMH